MLQMRRDEHEPPMAKRDGDRDRGLTNWGIKGYAVNQATGVLSELAASPFASDAAVFSGALVFTPSGSFLYSTGNGLNAFAVDAATGTLTKVAGSPFTLDVGSDPQASSLSVDPTGQFIYATQLLPKQQVVGFAIDGDSGKLSKVPGSPFSSSMPYSLACDPSGRFVFVGSDGGQIAVFSVSRPSGSLAEIDGSPFMIGGLQPGLAFAAVR